MTTKGTTRLLICPENKCDFVVHIQKIPSMEYSNLNPIPETGGRLCIYLNCVIWDVYHKWDNGREHRIYIKSLNTSLILCILVVVSHVLCSIIAHKLM